MQLLKHRLTASFILWLALALAALLVNLLAFLAVVMDGRAASGGEVVQAVLTFVVAGRCLVVASTLIERPVGVHYPVKSICA